MASASGKKSVKKWVLLLILPILMLILVALAQIIVKFILAKSTSDVGVGVEAETSTSIVKLVINIFSLLVGVVSVVALLLSPLWIVFLVRDLKGHARTKTTAIVLAVFFGYFSWLYTFEKDSKKFWINLGLSIVTIGYWSPVGWLWAIIDNANKPDEYYSQYNAHISDPPSQSSAPIAPAR